MFLSVKETAAYFGVSLTAVRNWMADKDHPLPYKRVKVIGKKVTSMIDTDAVISHHAAKEVR